MQSLSELLEKASEAVRRDLNHIFTEVSQKKLSPASARDLVAYTKLLNELADQQKEAAEEAANEIIRNETHARTGGEGSSQT